MRKILLSATLFAASASPAAAVDINLTFTDGQQQTIWAQPQMLEQCVSATVIRGDYTACRALSVQLQALAADMQRERKVAEEKKKTDEEAAAKKGDAKKDGGIEQK
jgi:hypothetical protein